jgi:hypothetical protein
MAASAPRHTLTMRRRQSAPKTGGDLDQLLIPGHKIVTNAPSLAVAYRLAGRTDDALLMAQQVTLQPLRRQRSEPRCGGVVGAMSERVRDLGISAQTTDRPIADTGRGRGRDGERTTCWREGPARSRRRSAGEADRGARWWPVVVRRRTESLKVRVSGTQTSRRAARRWTRRWLRRGARVACTCARAISRSRGFAAPSCADQVFGLSVVLLRIHTTDPSGRGRRARHRESERPATSGRSLAVKTMPIRGGRRTDIARQPVSGRR